MKRFGWIWCFVFAASALGQDAKRPMKVEDLFQFRRVSDAQISPNGEWVVYTQGQVDLGANKVHSTLWLASNHTTKSVRKPLTNSPKNDRHPRWSPDGKTILFESNRSGSWQLWAIDLAGGEARQVTDLSTGASSGIWSRDGTRIAFVSTVWPEYSAKLFKESDDLNRKRAEEAEKSPIKARVFTRLFFRHWDEYVEDKRQHLFVTAFDKAGISEPKDVTPGDRDAYPTSSTFSVGDDYCFSPDGKYLVFTATPKKNEAWNTNFDLCRVPVTGGTTDWETLTSGNLAADGAPAYSGDGKKLAYRAQRTAGFEADRWELFVCDCDASGKPTSKANSITANWDRSVDAFVWHAAGFYLTAEEEGYARLFRLDLKQTDPIKLTTQGSISSLSISENKSLALTQSFLNIPPEAYLFKEGAEGEPDHWDASQANASHLKTLNLPRPESVTVKGAGGTPMQMWILKPPGFDESKKWPVAFLVHGGPQGAWMDGWSNRWNPEIWAAQGYVVALPNPRGSTGFGQKYVNEISGDWGGKCYEDLMAGVAYLETLPYVDSQRIATAGASFGGYMMNWFSVNTGKFKCIINHCGVWNFESMYSTTEELWFDEWEHGGPPWGKNRKSYEKHSPHRLAGNLEKYRTPTLIIHNDLDFRVPVSEGIQVFTILQRLGVPSRFINFPDEGHWVLKPRNSEYWHREVFQWLTKYVPPGGR